MELKHVFPSDNLPINKVRQLQCIFVFYRVRETWTHLTNFLVLVSFSLSMARKIRNSKNICGVSDFGL